MNTGFCIRNKTLCILICVYRLLPLTVSGLDLGDRREGVGLSIVSTQMVGLSRPSALWSCIGVGEREGLKARSGDSSATTVSLKLATERLRGSCAEV